MNMESINQMVVAIRSPFDTRWCCLRGVNRMNKQAIEHFEHQSVINRNRSLAYAAYDISQGLETLVW